MANEKITIAVSPHYRGFGWHDKGLGMSFKPTNHLHPVVVSKDGNLAEVKKRLRLNQLLLLEGELDLTPVPDENEGLAEQVELLNQELSTEKGKVTSLTSELSTEKGKVTTLTGEKSALQTQVSNLENNVATLEEEIEDLLETIAELENAGVSPASMGETYTRAELEAMTVADLKAIIDGKEGIEYASGSLKPDLVDLLIGVEK